MSPRTSDDATLVPDAAASSAVLTVRSARVHFGGVRALDGVDLDLHEGEIHALLGHNGSGKSTLIKLLAGFHKPAAGTSITLDGHELHSRPAGAGNTPIRFVHQDLGLVDQLDAMDNFALTLGYMRTKSGRIDWASERARAHAALRDLGTDVDVTVPVGTLTSVERSTIAIARALVGVGGRGTVLVLDEPTATLSSSEVNQLLTVLRRVSASGTAVLYVSHRLDEIFEIADTYTALRNGKVVGRGKVAETTSTSLITLIAGHEVATGRRLRDDAPTDGPGFEVRGLQGPTLNGVSFTVRRGEILGIAGLQGSGRDEIPYAVVGESRDGTVAELVVDGRAHHVRHIRDAMRLGAALVPGDRLREGLVADFECRENATLAILQDIGRRGWMSRRAGTGEYAQSASELNLPAASARRPILTLSGGNQQRVLLAKWLLRKPELLVLSEPTAGVDVGTRQALYEIVRSQAARGMAVVVASSDVDDLVELADRVITLRAGDVVAEHSGADVTTETLIANMEGISSDDDNDQR